MDILRDRNWRPEEGEWEPIKISSEIDPSAYIPRSPQALEPWSARIAMDKLSRSKRPRLQRGSKGERNFTNRSTAHPDRSDRCTGPVWPVGLGNSNCRPVRPVAQTGQTGLSQTARQQSSKCQISSNRTPNPTKLGGKLPIYPMNIFPKDPSPEINRSWEIEGRSKRIGVFSRTQKPQFVRTRDSCRFGTRLDRLESSQWVHQTTKSRVRFL